ncbi:uridine kinase [Marinibactrum halimedae]|uniref:Uridine kinase n=1 Tax=Marinibactrum halimedae TaxID=1444977 RepID=A0AA37T356_9GAMM|nr:uridine kinase [Marinibactrum halimedae]MCD9460484.1 uridine kinase [Marinibactrum halimedae]GLS25890.1 uridine kinase [Marinibactrum halimedae]
MTKTIIAIVGASASGKSLFAQTIYQELSAQIPAKDLAIIEEDAYYRDQSHLPIKNRTATNYDHPDAFEHELLVEHLESLRSGQSVDVPVYDYNLHTRSDITRRVEPATVVIIEGILLLSDETLREQFDIKLFIDTPLDICLLRRIARDIQERGRTLESVSQQYESTVRPMFYEFIEPCKNHADIVVTRGGKNRIAIDLVKHKIRALLNTHNVND